GRPRRPLLDGSQGEGLEAPQPRRGPFGDSRVRLPEAGRDASGRQEGDRRGHDLEEAHPDAVAEDGGPGRQARHPGPPGARAEQRGARPSRPRAQGGPPGRAPVARHPGHRARAPAGAAHPERAEAAPEDRGLPDQEGGHQGPVLRCRGPGPDLGGGDRGGGADGRPGPRHPARRGQDRGHARPRLRGRGARGRRHLRRPLAHRTGPGRHRPPAGRAEHGIAGRLRAQAHEGRARTGGGRGACSSARGGQGLARLRGARAM
ncbi:MAG: Suppressor of sigma54-dependent transcription, PspA-like, partial [uncultured Solirubrobacterales bacterium]